MTFDLNKPNDQRFFLHKSFIGKFVGKAVGGLIGATPIGAVAKTVFNVVKPPARPTLPTGRAAALPVETAKNVGRNVKFGNGGAPPAFTTGQPLPFHTATGNGNGTRAPCDFPKVRDSQGRCRTPTSGEFGGEQFGVGVAVMGRYGAGVQPGSMIVDRAICGRGMQLGNDGVCYNKGQISNKQRQWPKGRKPLLTGGEMNAIRIAATAGRRLTAATKRLQTIGLMKKPLTRRAGRHQHAKPIAAVSV